MKKGYWVLIGAGTILLFMAGKSLMKWKDLIGDYFLKFEGFRSTPKWDYKQWTWGYGTRVPGSVDSQGVRPTGTITRTQALKDAFDHVTADYNYLSGLIKVSLTPGQWAALLSFSYNLGPGDADNLVPNINSRNWSALADQWVKYNKAGGVVLQDLVDRRQYEITNFLKDT